jgi:uncharacterized membrane protein YhhN
MDQLERRSWPIIMSAVLTAGMYVAVTGLLFGPTLHWPISSRTWALSGSSCFVLLSLTMALRFRQGAAWLTLMGLIACWLGDYLGPIHFQAGALSFLVAHLLFIAAWTWTRPNWKRSAATLGVVLLATTGIGTWLLPSVPGGDVPLVVAYMSVISVMVAVAGGTRGPLRRLTLLGAVLFYVSDIAVARGQYVAPGALNSWICYPLYYTACLLLAYSAWLPQEMHETTGWAASAEGSMP